MKFRKYRFLLIPLILGGTFLILSALQSGHDSIVSYQVNPKKQNLKLYWKDENGACFGSLGNLKRYIKAKKGKLLFAVNGGMYKKDGSPQGLYIEEGKTLIAIDTAAGTGNFYLQPNGVFYLNNKKQAFISRSEDLKEDAHIEYATQSGPMLVINGSIHPAFKQHSKNLNIRNGVGILPDGQVLFAISKTEVNFYEFAEFFLDAGCKNALYLDGFVSRAYCPEKKLSQADGKFGVIIGITE